MAKITKATIDALQPENGGLSYLWDSSLPGFGVRVSAAGVKSYVLRYRIAGRQRIKTLGRVGVLELSDVRAQAQARLSSVYAGQDPFQGHGTIETIEELSKAFQSEMAGTLKPKTLAGYKSLWNAHIIPLFGTREIQSLTDEDIIKLRKKMVKTPATFNRCCALVIVALKWHGQPVENHPFKKVPRYRESGRDRILGDAENQRLYSSFSEYKASRRAGWRYVDLFALLLLTGLRRDEWRLGRWDWIRWEECLYIMPDNKTGGRTVYLPQLAIEILKELHAALGRPKTGFIFPAPTTKKKAISWTWRTWDAMRKELQLDDLTIHDLRRTAGSMAHSKGGLSQRQVADFLGHKRMETSSRYIRDNAKREGAEAAAAAVASDWKKPDLSESANS